MRMASGDYDAILDSPIMSGIVRDMLSCIPNVFTNPTDKIGSFFNSQHFANIPYQWLSVRFYAVLRSMVERGAYKNREKAIQRLSGFFHDVNHISAYAPYCDAFVMDQPMAEIARDERLNLKGQFGVKIFSLNNWEEFNDWLDTLEAQISDEHRNGLAAAYPK